MPLHCNSLYGKLTAAPYRLDETITFGVLCWLHIFLARYLGSRTYRRSKQMVC